MKRESELDGKGVKISIIIPFYNVEKYIGECLESVTSQSLREIEIICIDDASPDSSRDIVLEYMESDDRIRLITHDVNRGVSAARNRGLEHAKGEYIYIIDSDDFLHPEALNKLYDCAKEDDAELVISDVCKYYEDGRMELYSHPYKYRRLKNWGGHAAWWFIFSPVGFGFDLSVRKY